MFDSLTDNGKGVLKLIIKEQINQIAKQKEGPTFKGKFIIRLTTIYFMTFHSAIWLKSVLRVGAQNNFFLPPWKCIVIMNKYFFVMRNNYSRAIQTLSKIVFGHIRGWTESSIG